MDGLQEIRPPRHRPPCPRRPSGLPPRTPGKLAPRETSESCDWARGASAGPRPVPGPGPRPLERRGLTLSVPWHVGLPRPRGDVSPSGAGKTYGLYSLFKEQLMRKTATSRNHRLEGNYAIKKIRGCGSRRRTVKLEAGAGEGSPPRRAPPVPTRSPGTGRAARLGRQDRQATEPGPSPPMSLPLPRRAPARWTWGGVPAPRWPCPQTRPPAGFSPSCKGPLYPDSQTG